jgi:RNA polymerase sigma-70 factor (ECF subfamily)
VDQELFEAEALPHLKRLYATAYRLTRNPADAEDLVQDVLLRAYRAFDRFEAGTSLRAWLYTILYHLHTDGLRRKGRRPALEELKDDGPPVPATQERLAGPEALPRALEALPAAFRMAVVLRDVEELTYAEIAGVLRVPIGTVMSRIHRGRALLRAALQETTA